MAVRLNQAAFEHAKRLVRNGQYIADERNAWSEHQPSARDENHFLEIHGYTEYGRWYLGLDDEANPQTKAHYKFPYGDFTKVHRCGLLTAESRAGQRGYNDVERAAHQAHELIEESRAKARAHH